MRSFFAGLSALAAVICLFLLIGTAGAMDLDDIDGHTGFVRMMIFTVLFGLFVAIASALSNKEEH